MELSGLRKCAENDLHVLSDTDFKAAITNHPKAITSVRQFATDHFKKASNAKTESASDAGESESETALIRQAKNQLLINTLILLNRHLLAIPKHFGNGLTKAIMKQSKQH
jgi:hypothetical protein